MCMSAIATMVVERLRDGVIIGTGIVASITMGRLFVFMERVGSALEKSANK